MDPVAMVSQNIFWFIAGLMLGTTAIAVCSALLRHVAARASLRERAFVISLAGALVVVATALYFHWGRPELIASKAARPAGHPAQTSSRTGAGSLDSAAERLAARLASGNGSSADWALLAQTYETLGRTEEASAARMRATAGREGPRAADDTGWIETAQRLRLARDFGGAIDAYRKAIASESMSADSWADYADALASHAGGKLPGEPAQAIEKALALDDHHVKALWLSASLARQERRHADALRIWRTLQTLIPDSSPDAAIIAANVAEATQLVGTNAVAIDGIVDIDRRLLAGVEPDAVLFVFAKASDSPGPPLAVWRGSPQEWPVTFRLDDSMAMIPGRRLSDFDSIVIEARLSLSGRAEAQPGDLQSASSPMRAQDAKTVKLRLARRIT